MNNIFARQSFILITFGVIIGLMMGGLIWIVASPPRGKPIALATQPSERVLSVYISGEVFSPGVYQVPLGSRVKDVVALAGGFLPSANVSQINQAAIVVDSSQINVLPLNSLGNLQETKININIASEEELETLPGIGPVSAKSIVDYRMENGPFKNIEEIQKVTGIGPLTYEGIKQLISTGE